MNSNLSDTDLLASMFEVSEQMTSEDKSKLNSLISTIEKYDIYDFICRISSLNLLIENQNKSILFDTLIAEIMSRGRTNYHSTIKMSNGKFKNVITALTSLGFSMMIDPAENLFIDRIQYYGNYWIFPGINYYPSYSLQAFLNVICLRNLSLPIAFTQRVHLIINFILHISDNMAKRLGYGMEMIKRIDQRNINFPNANLEKKLTSCLRFSMSYIKSMITDDSLCSQLFYNFDKPSAIDTLNGQQQDFFAHPFLMENEESIIVLNPTILTSYLIHQIVLLADEYDIKGQLIGAYNDEIWKDCIKSFRTLGHRSIDEKVYGIDLLDNNYCKEKILTVCSDKLLFAHFVCDAGDEYDSNSMFGVCDTSDCFPSIYDRTQYIADNLPELHMENIYHIVILNSFGRSVGVRFPKDKDTRTIALSPFDLHCIAVNERNRDNFIPKYIDSKQRALGIFPSTFVGELNNIEIYRSNNYSFYFSDDFNPRAGMMFFGIGDSLDYVIRATKRENRHLIASYDNIHLCVVALSDPSRNIYINESNSKGLPEFVNEFDKVAIWFTCKIPETIDEWNIYSSIINALSYWLAECKEIIESMNFPYKSIVIQIELSHPADEYDPMAKGDKSLCDAIQYKRTLQKIVMTWHPLSFSILDGKTNQSEKELMISLINELEQLSKTPANLQILDDVFMPPLKKKFFFPNIVNFPYLVPTNEPLQIISQEDEERLLDEIGEYFLSFPEYDYGRVPDDKRANLANNVVEYLYSLLQNEVASVKVDGFYERVCLDLETVMHHVMRSQSRYAYDIACYPEKTEDIVKHNNEANRTSIALKFLAEYIAAIPPNGNNVLGSMQYDRILAICSLIVDWAYKNDLFRYHIFNSPVEFLKSGRIGMPRQEEDYLFNINVAARIRKLESFSDPEIETYSYKDLWDDFQGTIDDAFREEFGFTFQQFMECVLAIAAYGDQLERDVKRVSRKIIVSEVSETQKLSIEVVNNIIDHISLTQRPDFLIPPSPFEKWDVYPWRFNRELSFTRRPIIQYAGDLIWGNRQLHHMWRYMIDLIMEGKFKARSPKLKQLIGKFSHKRGNDFNAKVAKKLSSFSGIIVFENLSKINGKKISGEDGNVLGDIDVFYIIPELKKLVVGEAKDFSFAKNPYEMDQEYQRIFVDGDKPCYMTKHKRRVEWVKTHLSDVIQHFNLSEGNWSVKSAMFVSEEIISNNFYHQKENIIVYSQITEQAVKNF